MSNYYNPNVVPEYYRDAIRRMPARIKSIEDWGYFWDSCAVEPEQLLKQYGASVAIAKIQELRLAFIANKVRQGLVHGDAVTLEYLADNY